MPTAPVLESRPPGHQDQNPGSCCLIQAQVDELQRHWIDPMCILHHAQERSSSRLPNQLSDKRLKRAGTLLLWSQGQLAIALCVLEIEQSRDERSAILVDNQDLFQLIELCIIAVRGRDARR